MGKLIYAMNVSLDGFVETPDHSLDWANVDQELHTWFNDRTREIDASIYGRRMYELMADYWPTADSDPSAASSGGRVRPDLATVAQDRLLDDADLGRLEQPASEWRRRR